MSEGRAHDRRASRDLRGARAPSESGASDAWAARRSRLARRALALFFAASALACSHEHATLVDCRAILDHVVEIELGERGFKDPALAARKREELATLLAPELRRCVGRPLPHGALECVKGAKTVEILSHRCLR